MIIAWDDPAALSTDGVIAWDAFYFVVGVPVVVPTVAGVVLGGQPQTAFSGASWDDVGQGGSPQTGYSGRGDL